MPAVIILLFGGLLWWGGKTGFAIMRALRARAWPVATGVIESSGFTESHSLAGYVGRVGRPYYVMTRDFVLEYTYTVSGSAYHGTHLVAGMPDAAWRGEHAVAQYPRGRSVVVHYDPTDPSDAGLEVHWPLSAILSLGVAAALGVLGVRMVRAPQGPTQPRPVESHAA